VRALIRAGADIENPDENGKTPLMATCDRKYVDILDFLVELGTNVHARTSGNVDAHGVVISSHKVDIRITRALRNAGLVPFGPVLVKALSFNAGWRLWR